MKWRPLLALAASLLLCGRGPVQSSVAITGVTVLDGRGGAPMVGVAVVVEHGRISSILPRGARTPRGARIIDARGHFLLPGYIDMHAHLLVPRCQPPKGSTSPFDRAVSERMLSKLLDFGITTVRSPATPTVEGLSLRDDLNTGRVRGPRAFASAEFINEPKMTDSQLRAYVADALRYRPDYFKVYARLAPEQVASVIDEAHRSGVPVIGHLGRTSWAEAARLRIDHLTHAVDWSEKTLRPEKREAYVRAVRERGPMRARLDWLDLLDLESPEVADTIEQLSRRGISVDPTLVAYDSKFSDPASPRYRRNRYVGIVPELLADWLGCSTGTADWTPDDRRRWERLLPKLMAFVRLMHERGVLLTTGSDLTNPWVIPGESLHQEYELLASAGIPPSEVLKMTGVNAARALRRSDIGVIEPGRRADLVLLKANPRKDIRNTRKIAWVMQGGELIGPKKLGGSVR